MSNPRPAPVRRRQITDGDLEAVADLLSRGFRLRPRSYWLRGLRHQAERDTPPDHPRFGYMLESEGRPVGALLTIHSRLEQGGVPFVRCNLSSWFVEPAFRAHAALLISYALKDRATTYLNISPAPNTWSTIEAQGFQAYAEGRRLVLPWLAGGEGRVRRLAELGAGALATLPERDLLADHAQLDCICLVVEATDGLHPFVFSRTRVFHRLVPTTQLVYCRDLAGFARFAASLGRWLLVRGHPSVLVDLTDVTAALPGLSVDRDRRRYVRGPHPPQPGDLAYTEGVFYGP